MKTLKCLLLGFFAVSQSHAQFTEGVDSIAPGAPMMLRSRALKASGKDSISLRSITITTGIETIQLSRDTIRPGKIDVEKHTIALATYFAYQKDFKIADQLFTSYNAKHVDKGALSLHAQVLYWMKAFDRSIDVYENTARLFPQPSPLHLDYARVLYNVNRLSDARRLLKRYRSYDSLNVEADIMTAYLDLWNGKTGSAGKKARLLLQKYPGNSEAKDILNQINNYSVPYFKTGTEFLSDNQPMKAHVFFAETGVYKSWLFAPSAQASVYQFRAANNPFHSGNLQLANTVQLLTTNKIKLKGGVFQQNGKEIAFTGGAEVSQKIAKNFLVEAGLERRPNQYTVASIKTLVMENVSALSLSYMHKEKWLAKAAYELLQYGDENKVHTAYLWVLAPVISRPRYSFSGGYAFRYADAMKNNFVSVKPLSELIATPPYDGAVSGVYQPYFTPENQKVHAVLASAKVNPSKKIEFSSRVSIGVFAKADNPYLFLDKRGNQIIVNSGYTQVDFMPATWVSELRLAASNTLAVAVNYSYDKQLFYTSHKGGIQLKYVFLQ